MKGDEQASPHADDAETSSAQSVNKACEACRASKIRCKIENGRTSCERCMKTGRSCVFNAPQARKRRVFSKDARVAELERQIKVLQLRLNKQQAVHGLTGAVGVLSSTQLRFQKPLTPAQWQAVATSTSIAETEISLSGAASIAKHDTQSQSQLYGLVSRDTAELLLVQYRGNFESQYPFVLTPATWNVVDLRDQWPITLLAILTATFAAFDTNIHKTLNTELLNVTSRAMLLETERSLDLVRAMVVTAIWYSPTKKLESLRHYKYAHLAATMIMDLERDAVDHDTEYHRTLLSCYFLCTGISLAMGRPTMIQYNETVRHSSNILALLDPCPQNQKLAAWIDLQRMAETAVADFFTNSLDIMHFDVQQNVESGCQRLDQWKQFLTFPLEGSMAIHYFQVRSRILSVCLYPDHPMEDFRPPFRIRPTNRQHKPSPELSPFYVRTTLSLISTLHNALDTVISMSALDLVIAPAITYARITHAVSVLFMIGTAILSSPEHALSKIVDLSTLRIEHYLSSMITKAHNTAAVMNDHKTPTKFAALLENMQRWWTAQRKGDSSNPLTTMDLRPFLSVPVTAAAIPSLDEETLPTTTTEKTGLNLSRGSVTGAVIGGDSGGSEGDIVDQSPEDLEVLSFELGELPDLNWDDFDTFLAGA